MKTYSDDDIMHQIYSKLDGIENKLNQLVLMNAPKKEADNTPDILTLLELPENLRCTALCLYELGDATADEIANITKKQRAVESAYLNELEKMGYVHKKRVGRMVYFSIEGITAGEI